MFARILLLTDLSEASESDLRSAASFRSVGASDVALLHVLDERKGISSLGEAEKARLAAQEESLIEEGWNVEILVRSGIPFDEIVRTALEREVSLVVMGQGHPLQRALTARLFGETAYRILEMCPLPILVGLERMEREDFLFRNVLYGCDLSDSSLHAFKYVERIAETASPELERMTILHVHERHHAALFQGIPGAGKECRERMEALIALEMERFQSMAERLKRAHPRMDVAVIAEEGQAVETILDTARATKATLVLLGAQGKAWSPQYRIGTVAYRVAQQAPCPVLVVPMHRMAYPV
ncbi:universal stress protein [Aminiphilus sp.]|uniref:universal stress protein n=1 Tax=Aminiphilus sp. TaxID=1872488 RepID=UPI002625D464|nr:universal stress protein [Aminiphilus sp.]